MLQHPTGSATDAERRRTFGRAATAVVLLLLVAGLIAYPAYVLGADATRRISAMEAKPTGDCAWDASTQTLSGTLLFSATTTAPVRFVLRVRAGTVDGDQQEDATKIGLTVDGTVRTSLDYSVHVSRERYDEGWNRCLLSESHRLPFAWE